MGLMGRKTIRHSLKLAHSSLILSGPSGEVISEYALWNTSAANSDIKRQALNGIPSLPGALFFVQRVASKKVSLGTGL